MWQCELPGGEAGIRGTAAGERREAASDLGASLRDPSLEQLSIQGGEKVGAQLFAWRIVL